MEGQHTRVAVRCLGQVDAAEPTRTTLAHVRARRRGRSDGSVLAQLFAGLLQPLMVLDELDLHAGLELFREHDGLGSFDCVLASAALRRGAEALVSADGAFTVVPG